MNQILDEHAPSKIINKYKFKFKPKSWITPAIQRPITVKNKLLKRFINTKDSQTKETFHRQYKDYRNMLSKSKSNYYNQHFRANMNNIKNTWKRIKSIITIKNLSSDIPKSLSCNGLTITNKVEISNIFNNYFTIAEKAKESINPSHKHFSEFLKDRTQNSLFLRPMNKSDTKLDSKS